MTYPDDYIDKVICGDCLEVLKNIPDNSIDACVTDPPYELGFMGKAWDKQGIAYRVDLWREVLRVLKPGGHLLSFGGSRTYHRIACAIEDAGFEIRDQIMWVYGSGFPKSLNIGKAINKIDGVEFDEIPASGVGFMNAEGGGGYNVTKNQLIQKGESSDRAKEWEGWGTALKPAHEPICLARNPLSEKTVAENCLKWGTGGLNIDGCRVGTEITTTRVSGGKGFGSNFRDDAWEPPSQSYQTKNPAGRFPANFIHDGSEEVAGLMPRTGKSQGGNSTNIGGFVTANSDKNKIGKPCGFGDSGSAARFFYCAKASKAERNRGCEKLQAKREQISMNKNYVGSDGVLRSRNLPSKNYHPTVKPLALMRYLVKLITREGQVVIDPFAGSGSTLIACKQIGRRFVGIDTQEDYCKIARARLAGTPDSLFRGAI